MKFLSLLSGCGGMDLGLEKAGLKCVGQIEKMPYALKVLKKHWPEVPKWKDICEVNSNDLPDADLIASGFPCQDLSIAGTRKGLKGENSSLFWECYRIIKDKKPKWVLLENVPGLLSSNNGKDIQIILDSLTQIGYAIDIDIKDSQEFGLAQRRKRVFIVCVKLKDLLKKKTILSKQILADLLLQQLLNLWDVIQQVSYAEKIPLNSENLIEHSVISLKKRTDLFLTMQEKSASNKLQKSLNAVLVQFGIEAENLEHFLIESKEQQNQQLMEGDIIEYHLKKMVKDIGSNSISMWLSKLSEEIYEAKKLSTISTLTNPITSYQIYIFANLLLSILKSITQSINWSKNYWNVAQSVLILIKECIKYADKNSNVLFTENQLRNYWWNYIISASDFQKRFERRIRKICPPEILFEPKGNSGHNKKSRRMEHTGLCISTRDGERYNPTQETIIASTLRGQDNDQPQQKNKNFVAQAVQAEGHGRNSTSQLIANTVGAYEGRKNHPTTETHIAHSIGSEKRGTPAIQSTTLIAQIDSDRKGKTSGLSRNLDSRRGIIIGNAVSVPVARWIGRRIIRYEKGLK